jgi:hypothetical protein
MNSVCPFHLISWLVLVTIISRPAYALSEFHRRSFLLTLPGIATSPVWALDVEAFMKAELSKDDCDPSAKKCIPKAKLSEDQALCQFGQPSKERGDACVRAGMSTQLKRGGVDAYGKLDRGDYIRCKQFYELENGKYVKKTECK